MNRNDLRDSFAIQILNGFISSREQWLSLCKDSKGNPYKHICKVSYELADEMLKAR